MHWALAEELNKDRERQARAAALRPAVTPLAHPGDRIVIRRSGPGDGPAIARLAQLDEHEWAGGPAVLAEMDGDIRAAVPLDGSESFADPFFETADVVALLELRAGQLGRPAPSRRRFQRTRSLL
jgi:hypothetical protein